MLLKIHTTMYFLTLCLANNIVGNTAPGRNGQKPGGNPSLFTQPFCIFLIMLFCSHYLVNDFTVWPSTVVNLVKGVGSIDVPEKGNNMLFYLTVLLDLLIGVNRSTQTGEHYL